MILIDTFSAASHLETYAPLRGKSIGFDRKGDPENREFREKVYRAAFGALDCALKANLVMNVEAPVNHRKSLQAKITEIESKFMPVASALALGSSDAALAPKCHSTAMRQRKRRPFPSAIL